jgi:hypothetical protein
MAVRRNTVVRHVVFALLLLGERMDRTRINGVIAVVIAVVMIIWLLVHVVPGKEDLDKRMCTDAGLRWVKVDGKIECQ